MRPDETLMAAVRHHQAGQFAEADRLYAQGAGGRAAAISHALHLRGALAHAARAQRGCRQADRAGDRDRRGRFRISTTTSASRCGRSIASSEALRALGARGRAQSEFRAGAAQPRQCAARGRPLRRGDRAVERRRAASAAIAARRTTASACRSRKPDARTRRWRTITRASRCSRASSTPTSISRCCIRTAARPGEAVAAVMRSIAIRETPENRTLFARLVSGIADRPRRCGRCGVSLTRALTESWGTPDEVAPACMALIRHGPASAAHRPRRAGLAGAAVRRRAARAGGARGAERSAAARPDGQFGRARSPIWRNFSRPAALPCSNRPRRRRRTRPTKRCSALRPCWRANVSSTSTSMRRRPRRRRARSGCASASMPRWRRAKPPPRSGSRPSRPMCRCMSLPARRRCWRDPGPHPIAALLAQQVRAPREEAALRATIRQLTPIGDGVSQAVQAQYEANPYPRWIRMGTPRRYASPRCVSARDVSRPRRSARSARPAAWTFSSRAAAPGSMRS